MNYRVIIEQDGVPGRSSFSAGLCLPGRNSGESVKEHEAIAVCTESLEAYNEPVLPSINEEIAGMIV